jgi:hypothetical protein
LLEALSSNFENLDGLKPAFAQGDYARKSLSPRSMSEASRQMSLLDVAARGFGEKLLKKNRPDCTGRSNFRGMLIDRLLSQQILVIDGTVGRAAR